MRKLEDFILAHGPALMIASFFVGVVCGLIREVLG